VHFIFFSTQASTGEIKCLTNIPLPCAFHFLLHVSAATQASYLHLHQMMNNGHPSSVFNHTTLTIAHSMHEAPSLSSIKPLDYQHKSTLALIFHE
jgi:hypothetical protein